MAKSTVPRHSKTTRKSMTIELEPSSIVKQTTSTKDIPEPEPVGFDPAIQAKAAPVAEKAEPVTERVDQNASAEPESSSSSPAANFGRGGQASGGKRVSSGPDQFSSVQKSNDSFGRLASGLIGGVVVLLGAAALQWAGVLPSPKADVSSLEQQIAQLRDAPKPLDEGSQTALNSATASAKQALDQIGALSTELNSVKQSVADIQNNASAGGTPLDTNAIDARIASLEEQLNVSKQQVAQADGAAAGATTRLDALEAKVNDTSGQTNMALAMAATGLKAAVDRGEPYKAELDTYIAVAPAAGDVETLRPTEARGIPTVNTLAGEFGDVAARIIASTRTVDPNAGVLDRLWASASGLVEARPVGMIEGEGVDAITARIEAHLNAGDLAAAIAEWDKLPDTAKTVSADFGSAMKARQNASTAVSKALSDALSGIKTPANQE
ncbi:mitofilin family membrane protein [Phyllobacterium sp. SB3]|uniref:COG4223 family protein n=1 Tax=Phyllobacterium sp. SB3 TaxID=3156073 RepID=UPI0032AEA3F3